MNQLIESNQKVELSGTGAAHQNVFDEVWIEMVVNMVRTIMLHAEVHSKEVTYGQCQSTTMFGCINELPTCMREYRHMRCGQVLANFQQRKLLVVAITRDALHMCCILIFITMEFKLLKGGKFKRRISCGFYPTTCIHVWDDFKPENYITHTQVSCGV